MDWREGTETMTLNETVTWQTVDGEVFLNVADGAFGIFLSKDQAVNMLCGLAHVVGKLQ